jgi:hypothetical protein
MRSTIKLQKKYTVKICKVISELQSNFEIIRFVDCKGYANIEITLQNQGIVCGRFLSSIFVESAVTTSYKFECKLISELYKQILEQQDY